MTWYYHLCWLHEWLNNHFFVTIIIVYNFVNIYVMMYDDVRIYFCVIIYSEVYIWVILKNKHTWKNYFLCIICLFPFTLVNNLFMFIISLLLITCIFWLLMHRNIEPGWMNNEHIEIDYIHINILEILVLLWLTITWKYIWTWYYIDNTCNMYCVNIVYSGECIVYCWYYIGKPLRP